MSQQSLQLSRRQALGALATIGAGSAAIGAGTFAAFSDTETSNDSLSTDSITLEKGTQTLGFTTANIEPGDSGSSSVTVESTGTAGGRLEVAIADVTNSDVESTGPEEDAEDGTNVPLADQLEIKCWVEEASPTDGNEGQFDAQYDYGLKSDGSVAHGSGATLNYAAVADYPAGSESESANVYQTMTFADSSASLKEFYVEWQLPQDATNAVQRDKTEITFDLTLTQT